MALTVEFTGSPIMSTRTRFVIILTCRDDGSVFVYDTTGQQASRWYQAHEALPEDCS